jgi:SlyX protein
MNFKETGTPMESRIIELEIKASFAEDMLDELNRTVFRQQQQIDLLANEIRALRDQIRNAQPGEQRSLRDDIPPHY